MDTDYFSQIAQAILKQKQRMEQLEAENRELRRYLDDLRTGRGIFVEISGRRFALRDILSPRDSLGIPG
jgi:cell division protein FtsB